MPGELPPLLPCSPGELTVVGMEIGEKIEEKE
jgi:hypothetical protein